MSDIAATNTIASDLPGVAKKTGFRYTPPGGWGFSSGSGQVSRNRSQFDKIALGTEVIEGMSYIGRLGLTHEAVSVSSPSSPLSIKLKWNGSLPEIAIPEGKQIPTLKELKGVFSIAGDRDSNLQHVLPDGFYVCRRDEKTGPVQDDGELCVLDVRTTDRRRKREGTLAVAAGQDVNVCFIQTHTPS